MVLPRLTGAIRAFSTVTANYKEPKNNNDDVAVKRRQRSEQQSAAALSSWKQLVSIIGTGTSGKENVRYLLSAAKEIGEK